MKTENMPQHQIAFTALYWGQRVLQLEGSQTLRYVCAAYIPLTGSILQLRSLTSLTDDEAVEVARIKGWIDMLNDKGNINAVKRFLFQAMDDIRVPFEIAARISDYLRSRGFNIGYMDLSAQQVVEYGWAQEVDI